MANILIDPDDPRYQKVLKMEVTSKGKWVFLLEEKGGHRKCLELDSFPEIVKNVNALEHRPYYDKKGKVLVTDKVPSVISGD